MSGYKVIGKQRFRGHAPGETFYGELAPEVEARAIARRDIELVDTEPLVLDPTRARLPRSWDPDIAALERS